MFSVRFSDLVAPGKHKHVFLWVCGHHMVGKKPSMWKYHPTLHTLMHIMAKMWADLCVGIPGSEQIKMLLLL